MNKWRLLGFLGVTAFVAVLCSPGPAAAYDERTLLVDTAVSVTGIRYRIGGESTSGFDCSGFVFYTFSQAGLVDRIGGSRMRAREYQSYFRKRGLLFTDYRQAKIGDLAFWGSPARHIGIVTSFSRNARPSKVKPRVTSALTGWGIAEVRFDLVEQTAPFSGFARVELGVVPDPTPEPTPSPTATPEPTATPTPSASPEITPEITPTI